MVLNKLEQESKIALRHLQVLKIVKENQPIGIFKLAELMELPRHKIRYSLRILEQAGIIKPTQYGAVLKDDSLKVITDMKTDVKDVVERINQMADLIQTL